MDSVDEPPHDLCLRTWWVRKSGHRWIDFRERRGRVVEAEFARVEIRVDLRRISSRNLKFACPYQARYEFVACYIRP